MATPILVRVTQSTAFGHYFSSCCTSYLNPPRRMEPTETNILTATKLERIAWLSAVNPEKEFHQLMHHFNLESLLQCFHELDGRKAVGDDGVTKEQYQENLIPNLLNLLERMKRMAYIPGAVRLVLIPKEGKPGATRSLGISKFEDKIFQKMVQKVLESI